MLPDDYPAPSIRRILIVEDDEMIAGIYKRKFETAGFTVNVETNGSEGYYSIFKSPPDVVLLDLLLPGMDGPNIIRKFRAQRKFSELPIIVFTNAYLTNMGRDAVNAGATRVFNKATVTPQEIVDAVVKALNQDLEPPVASRPAQAAPQQEATEDDSLLFGMAAESLFHHEPPKKPSTTPPVIPDALSVEGGTIPVAAEAARNMKPLALAENVIGGTPEIAGPPAPAEPTDRKETPTANEGTLQALVFEEFLQKSGNRIYGMRQILRALQVGTSAPRGEAFIELSRIAHTMSVNAAIVGLNYLAQIAAALEALAWELFEKPSQFETPTRQTIAKTIDMMARLVDCRSSGQLKEFSQFNVLVVDDDGVARKMITKTLDRVKLSHVATGRPELAMELLADNAFDLIILDVKMEGMTGFELCTAIRQMPRHRHCHVIFVSGLNDFQSKAVSTQAGGNDFIVKPFAPMELALKALLHMVTSQLDQVLPSDVPAENEEK